MRKIQASEAKARLLSLLDDVEQGESLVITRHGRSIARLVPEVDRRQKEIDEAIASLNEIRKQHGCLSTAEILSARDEGRKY